MKNTSLALICILFSTNTKIMAQARDSVQTKKIIEQGAHGDIILGKQNQKKQLNASPEFLQQRDSVYDAKSTQPKKKKSKSKSRQ
jgi:hypothetical protein